uniref:Uncharacterized protein n=1 Tax=Sipha flava TaxID=143950 RepID=A0A2S2R3A2_9HEMI
MTVYGTVFTDVNTHTHARAHTHTHTHTHKLLLRDTVDDGGDVRPDKTTAPSRRLHPSANAAVAVTRAQSPPLPPSCDSCCYLHRRRKSDTRNGVTGKKYVKP